MAVTIDEHTQYTDEAGKPLVNGTVTIGVNNSSDPENNLKDIFSDPALKVALANPQTLDSFGRTVNKIYTDGQYSFLLKNSADTQKLLDSTRGETSATQGAILLINVTGTDDLTADASPTPITALVDKQQYTLTLIAPPTGAMTVDIDSTGQKDLVTSAGLTIQNLQFAANDVLVFVFNSVNDQFEIISGGGDVVGVSVSIANRVVGFLDTTGKILVQGAKLITDLVGGPASSLTNNIATYSDTTGKTIKDSGRGIDTLGKVLQTIYVQVTATQDLTVGANLFGVISGLTVTITPSKTTSKVLITCWVSDQNRGDANNSCAKRLKRGGTIIGNPPAAASRQLGIIAGGQGNISGGGGPWFFMFLDSPASTSAQIYTVEAAASTHTGFFINRSGTDGDAITTQRTTCAIMAQEIGA